METVISLGTMSDMLIGAFTVCYAIFLPQSLH